jgi:hypothetical protein
VITLWPSSVVRSLMTGSHAPLKPGDLIVNRKTNKPGLIVKVSESHRLAYGDMTKRLLYKVLEGGNTSWIHDIALSAEYRRIDVTD